MLDYVGYTRAQTLMRDQFDYSITRQPAPPHHVRLRMASAIRGLAALLADTADHLDRRLERAEASALPSRSDYAASSSSS